MTRKYVSSCVIGALLVQLGGYPVLGQKLINRQPEAVEASTDVRLGPGDQIALWVRDSEEISNRTYRIQENGEIRIPLLGRFHAGGLTVTEIESSLADKLKSVVLEPDVHVSIAELRSSTVTVTGAVKNPGIVQIRDRLTLLQIIALSGGLAPDAGHLVRITRKTQRDKIPLAGAQTDESGRFSMAEEDVDSVLEGTSAAANLILQPEDVVNVLPAPVIYVMGEVRRAGGLALARQDPNVSVLQAVAMAEGMTDQASPQKAMILRPSGSSTRQTIGVDLKAVLSGQSEDVHLRPNDILFIPNNKSLAKALAVQAAQIAASIAIGVTIVRAGNQTRR